MAQGEHQASNGAGERAFRPFEAGSTEVEVDSHAVHIVLSGIVLRGVGLELLRREGIDPNADVRWHPWQSWLNVFRTISERLGPDTLYSIGHRVPYVVEFPANEMRDVPTALRAINVAYHNAHRNGDIGCYEFIENGDGSCLIRCNNPYPCDFDFGIIQSLVDRFRGSLLYSVHHVSGQCRKLGGSECRYQVMRQPR